MAESRGRLVAIDWMRGIVMVLMAVDHASDALNAGRLAGDSAWFGAAADPTTAQFLTRWISHLCAPTFVFLAGTAIALSFEKRLAQGAGGWALDAHLAVRGLLLILFEAWMSLAFGIALFQVLYAIGLALICMTVLRRLPTYLLVGGAVFWIAGGEFVQDRLGLVPPSASGGFASLASGLIFVPTVLQTGLTTWLSTHEPFQSLLYKGPVFVIAYPLLGWLPTMMLGWAFGRVLLGRRKQGEGPPVRLLATTGAALLVLFAIARGLQGYGDMHYPRVEGPWWQWLHVSKYPPSLTFLALEGGLMALLLAWLFRHQDRLLAAGPNHPLLVFGQTALFFYLLHIHLMVAISHGIWGSEKQGGLPATYFGAFAILVVLYPACRWFRGYKARHPDGWARYI